MVRGRHTFKFGVDIRRIRLNNSGNTLTTSIAQLRHRPGFHRQHRGLGHLPARRGRSRQPAHFRSGLCAGRVQSHSDPHTEPGPALRVLLRGARDSEPLRGCRYHRLRRLLPKGTPYYSPNTNDFGPRVGLAWAPAMLNGKTVIRSGFRHLLRRQPERRLQRSGRKRRAPLFPGPIRFSRPGYPLIAFLDPANQLFSPKASPVIARISPTTTGTS